MIYYQQYKRSTQPPLDNWKRIRSDCKNQFTWTLTWDTSDGIISKGLEVDTMEKIPWQARNHFSHFVAGILLLLLGAMSTTGVKFKNSTTQNNKLEKRVETKWRLKQKGNLKQ